MTREIIFRETRAKRSAARSSFLPHGGARRALCALPGAALACAVSAQITSNPVDLPKGPAAPGFDLKRFSNAGNGAFKPFYVEKTEPLKDVLDQGRIAPDTRVLVFSAARGTAALIADQMAFHHIAEGTDGGKEWMVVF